MSGSGGGSRGSCAVAAAGIPAGSRKLVQSLKEIVNLPDQDIYAALKDCGMDPNEAVQRLLSQDSFHEVKSKREKKKEVKELPEFWTRTTNSTSGRGLRVSSDRVPQPSFTLSSSNGIGGYRGKDLQKKEDGICSFPSPTNMGSNYVSSRTSTITSKIDTTESFSRGVTAIPDSSFVQSLSSSGNQHGWIGIPGHFSMADIVKMGRPQGMSRSTTSTGNASNVSHHFTSDTSNHGPHSGTHDLPSELDQSIQSSQGPHQQAEGNNFEPRDTVNKHVSHDARPSVTHPNPETASAFLDTSGSASTYADMSKALVNDVIQHQNLHDEAPELVQSIESSTSLEQFLGSEPTSEGEIVEYNSEGEEVNVEISSAATNSQDTSLGNGGLARTTLEENSAVIIPKHLQVTNSECSHLSFGSFSSRVSTSLPGSSQPKLLHSSSEVIKEVDYVPPLVHSNAGNSSYYDSEDIKSQRNEDTVSRGGTNTKNFEISSVSEPDVRRDDAMSSTHEHQYNLPSLSGYGTSTSSRQLHNLSSLSNLMQPYTGCLPSSPASTLPLRDLDLSFSSFLTTQSVSTKHSGSTVPLQEAKPSVFSNLQVQAPQSSPTTNIPTVHAIPPHLPLHPYPQGTLPLGPFANLISYPFLPQSYTYMPPAAFPSAYPSNDPFHQSPSPLHSAGLKFATPQYKNNLPQPPGVASGYGNIRGSTNIPRNFSLNPSTTSSSTNSNSGFAETLSAQYKEGTHYIPLHQNESSPIWVQGGSSRTASPLPPNTFYGFQGPNQLGSFRQSPQPSHYGQMGYLNFFQNQLGRQSQDQQQNAGEANLGGSPCNPPQQSHPIWQHGY